MATATKVTFTTSLKNLICFACSTCDPDHYDVHYTRLFNFIQEIKTEGVKNELLSLMTPLLCHLYIEMLLGENGVPAQMLLKKYTATLHQINTRNETPEKNNMNQLLHDIGTVCTFQEIDSHPLIVAFRSCKYEIYLSQKALNLLKVYLDKCGHDILIDVLQTRIHIYVNNNNKNPKDEEYPDEENNIATTKHADEDDIDPKFLIYLILSFCTLLIDVIIFFWIIISYYTTNVPPLNCECPNFCQK